jgi:hypothetical protein
VKIGTAPLPPLEAVKVLDQLRERIRYLHYSLRPEEAYVHWARGFIRFQGLRHPSSLGGAEVEAFLSSVANARRVSSSTHKQALASSLPSSAWPKRNAPRRKKRSAAGGPTRKRAPDTNRKCARNEERRKLRALFRDASRLQRAKRLREFIAAVEDRARQGDELTPEKQQWIEWARAKGDWLDPLVRSSDPILDAPEPEAPSYWQF